MGSGTGATTQPLAQALKASITAENVLPFQSGRPHLIWLEGTVYNRVFANDTTAERPLLSPGPCPL